MTDVWYNRTEFLNLFSHSDMFSALSSLLHVSGLLLLAAGSFRKASTLFSQPFSQLSTLTVPLNFLEQQQCCKRHLCTRPWQRPLFPDGDVRVTGQTMPSLTQSCQFTPPNSLITLWNGCTRHFSPTTFLMRETVLFPQCTAEERGDLSVS